MSLPAPGDPRREVVADGAVSLLVPDAWETVHHPHDGVELVVVEPEQDGLFRANLVLTVTDVAMSLRDWQVGTESYLAAHLADYVPLDAELLAVGGQPGLRRLATYATEDNRSVTVEQRSTLVDKTGVTLTATTSTLAWAAQSQLLAHVFASLVLDPDAAGRRSA
ncbi:hypothetical protein [Terrabacter sp. NPDC080008]|uniref:hypothetical protein n=1 Tax=Terrabacter sp. NPDC080008 TaxID=3155176 RepID=UPI003450652B